MTRWVTALLLIVLTLVAGFLVVFLFPVESDEPAPTPVTVSTTLTPEGTPAP